MPLALLKKVTKIIKSNWKPLKRFNTVKVNSIVMITEKIKRKELP